MCFQINVLQNYTLPNYLKAHRLCRMSQTTDILLRLRAAGLSQTEISKRTGIPQPRLSRWENGASPAGADDALKLAALAAEVAAIPTPTPEQAAA